MVPLKVHYKKAQSRMLVIILEVHFEGACWEVPPVLACLFITGGWGFLGVWGLGFRVEGLGFRV